LRVAPAAAGLLAIASILVGPALAGDQVEIASDGTVHSVSAGFELAVGNSNPIFYVRQSLLGDSVTRILPGTEDGANFQPSIAIDPVTDAPVVVWTRVDRGDAEIYLSRYDGTDWTNPIAVAPGRGDDLAPKLRIGANLLHVLWRRETSGGDVLLLRASLDRASLAPVLGPESLPTTGIPLVSPDGGEDAPCESPAPEDSFVVEEVWNGDPESPHVLIVYGIRDEPMPVGYRQGFILPPGMDDINDPSAAWIGSRFVLGFVVGNQLVYTILDDGEWSDLRRINLDGMSAADARTELAAMLLRTDPALGF
jgi:hypothetical protein